MTTVTATTTATLDEDREKAIEALKQLEREILEEKGPIPSWIDDGTNNVNNSEDDPDVRLFHSTGFLHIPQFCTEDEYKGMKNEMIRLVLEEWHPEQGDGLDSFGTNDKENTARGDYFLESSTRVHFFTEPHASIKDETTGGRTLLKPEYLDQGTVKKLQALNKVGHALHMTPGNVFHSYTMSDKLRNLILKLGWKDPVIPQSMYIFKQARVGGPVTSHQDSTFLFTTPKQTCLGLWLALDDSTLENGCLWVRPKSHREPVRRQYVRNPNHFGQDTIDARSNTAQGNLEEPSFIMNDLDVTQQQQITWEGDLPGTGDRESLWKAGFVPVEVKAGDLLAFCGTLDHLSLANTSEKERHTFQLHLVEGPREGVVWSPSNWLQYPDNRPFLSIVEDK